MMRTELVASREQDDQLGRLMVLAYRDDPILNWILRKDAARDAGWSLFFRTALELYHPFGAIYATDGAAGCALWAPPGKWRITKWQQFLLAPRIIRILGLRGVTRGLGAMDRMDQQHPSLPHYYLYMLAVHPTAQGQGHGSALLETGLARVDQERVGAFLETSNPRNLPLYRRHGFEITTTVQLAPDAPTLWFMWRPARGP
jgi:ribosomal protein S18 acetylase RimI-like enzyme